MKSIRKADIISNELLTDDVCRMVLKTETEFITAPGQFINITIPGLYLKRPISISDWTENTLTCIYKVVGKGTAEMKKMKAGDQLEILVGLGNGYDLEKMPETVLVLGGGVGIPPMYGLTKELLKAGKKPIVVLGYQTKDMVFLKEEFEALNVPVYVSSNDGTVGTKGFVTDVMKNEGLCNTYYTACGPLPMLKSIYHTSNTVGQLSFEERMGCGYGGCMGCSKQTKNGPKRVCTEGPIFESEEILWED